MTKDPGQAVAYVCQHVPETVHGIAATLPICDLDYNVDGCDGTNDPDDDDDDEFNSAFNRHATLTMRLILTELIERSDEVDIDTDRDIIVTEVDNCADSWRDIAIRTAFEAAHYMSRHLGKEEAVADMQRRLALTIDTLDQP